MAGPRRDRLAGPPNGCLINDPAHLQVTHPNGEEIYSNLAGADGKSSAIIRPADVGVQVGVDVYSGNGRTRSGGTPVRHVRRPRRVGDRQPERWWP
ncbi:hypothetical protein AB0D49_28815 [Streptomyces sp. NPDC048290]|uniref:hypothetical protein n=1 Tax=Streptomyces sp. NPDC048290 TaxID=3155811 RepID=UPI00342D602B